jgi:S1-C subfamily serine protease
MIVSREKGVVEAVWISIGIYSQGMGWLDIVIALLVVLAALNGLRLGAMVQVFSFAGFFSGLALGIGLAFVVAKPVGAGISRTILVLALVLGIAVATSIAGSILGGWASVTLKRWHLGAFDAGVGAAIGGISILLSAWLIAGFLVQTQITWLNQSIDRSAVLRSVDQILPPVPSAVAQVQSLLSSQGFPSVFAAIAPPLATPTVLPSTASALQIAAPAVSSTYKILGNGCGAIIEGSSFVVQRGLLVTNAHVVAGIQNPTVVVGGITYAATPVVFDPSLDIAVLRTKAPTNAPLSLATSTASRGTPSAVVGFPENGALHVASASVSASFEAVGRDIYGGSLVTRQVYEINAQVLPGNSGGPLVAQGGSVLGVVFSRSTVNANVGYALTSSAIAGDVARGEASSTPVSTGACAPG